MIYEARKLISGFYTDILELTKSFDGYFFYLGEITA